MEDWMIIGLVMLALVIILVLCCGYRKAKGLAVSAYTSTNVALASALPTTWQTVYTNNVLKSNYVSTSIISGSYWRISYANPESKLGPIRMTIYRSDAMTGPWISYKYGTITFAMNNASSPPLITGTLYAGAYQREGTYVKALNDTGSVVEIRIPFVGAIGRFTKSGRV